MIGGSLCYEAQRVGRKQAHALTRMHARTHYSPLIHSFVCFEFVVGFGSAFPDWKWRHHYYICQHLPFLNHHFSWLLFPQCLFHPISFPPKIKIYLPLWFDWLHLFIKLTIPMICLCICFLCDSAYSGYRWLALLCVWDCLIYCIHLKSIQRVRVHFSWQLHFKC